ncbi:MAG: dihydropteroate synthase [Bacteroidetes bacterium]|nr:dihydropteroate synthase [Bacteroidota bacterium]
MFTLNCKGKLWVVDKPLVMGIINLTPDSFYAGSRFNNTDTVLKQVEKMLYEEADILDLGAQSTRPGSERITADEELFRVIPALEAIVKKFPKTIISVDTYYSKVAKQAVETGASIINDISGGSMDAAMVKTIASLNVPYILMHMKGEPGTMQKKPQYENVTREILDYFISRIAALRNAGILDIIIDPGFGFGKTIDHNFEILKNLSLFKILELPILTGLSRKSSVYKTLGVSANDSLNGTTVMHTIALLNGANILRVHDVKEAREAIKLVDRYTHN